MGAIESNQSGVPAVQLVVLRPEGTKAEAPAMALVGNLRQQRISNKVRYQAAKTAFWKGQGEKGREAQFLEELLEGRR